MFVDTRSLQGRHISGVGPLFVEKTSKETRVGRNIDMKGAESIWTSHEIMHRGHLFSCDAEGHLVKTEVLE
jgi:hypothetical protein